MSRLLKSVALVALLSAAPASAKDADYIDNRSSAEDVVISYYNAISHGQFARAFSYGLRAAPLETQVELDTAFEAFRDAYTDVEQIRVRLGTPLSDAGAGGEMTAIPVILQTRDSAGGKTVEAACHYLMQLSPSAQDAVPFEPIRIERTSRQVINGEFATVDMPDCSF
jgi:hypothetical protein